MLYASVPYAGAGGGGQLGDHQSQFQILYIGSDLITESIPQAQEYANVFCRIFVTGTLSLGYRKYRNVYYANADQVYKHLKIQVRLDNACNSFI